MQLSIENADLDRGTAFGSWRDRAQSDWTGWGGNLVFGAETFFGVAPGLSVGPTARFDYAFMHRPDVTESSGIGSALYVHSETYQSLRSAFGLQAPRISARRRRRKCFVCRLARCDLCGRRCRTSTRHGKLVGRVARKIDQVVYRFAYGRGSVRWRR